MATETEYKYLVEGQPWIERGSEGKLISQWYLKTEGNCTVRVRVKSGRAYLTIKSAATGPTRYEYEYEIPVKDATRMARLTESSVITKARYEVLHKGHTWEIDVFRGDNAGLVLAEIELPSEDERYELPPWVTENVTDDMRYTNVYLSRKPFQTW